MAKILADCRDIAIHRLITSFAGMLDRVGEMLMDRASRTDVREDQVACLAARDALQQGKAGLLEEFERRLRSHVDDRIAGKIAPKTEFAKLESDKLTLIDTHAMDESVVTGNITRVIENLCHEEIQLLNRGIGHLLDQPDLETDSNPFAPATIVESFAESLETIKAEPGAKFTILKDDGNKIADRLGATRTPEVYVLDNKGKLAYHGRIDDAQKVESVTSNDLRNALDEMGSGKAVTKTGGAAFGCTIKRVS